MSEHDATTLAAIEYMLRGEGVTKNGKFFVTVRGGHIVSVDAVARVSSETIVNLYQAETDPMHRRVELYPQKRT